METIEEKIKRFEETGEACIVNATITTGVYHSKIRFSFHEIPLTEEYRIKVISAINKIFDNAQDLQRDSLFF